MPTRIFYGWWMVLVTAIALTAGPILVTGTFGIFIKPLAETFGWSRSAISLAFSIVASFASFAAPVVGVLADRFGPRKVILCAALLFGSGFLSFASLSASIWHFYGLYLFTALGGIGLTTIPYATAISRWFVRQRRSEEHTSELQSRFELVCRLLLEKKKAGKRGYPTTSSVP